MEGERRSIMKYFNANMTANEVRSRLYELLYLNRVSETEVQDVLREHDQMCDITVSREMEMAAKGWLTEQN